MTSCFSLSALPEGIGSLTSLRILDASRTPLAAMPVAISNLGLLEVLNLSCWSNLVALPPFRTSHCGLTSLRDLNLRCCIALHNLPDSMGGLSALTRLDASNCTSIDGLKLGWLPANLEVLSQ